MKTIYFILFTNTVRLRHLIILKKLSWPKIKKKYESVFAVHMSRII